MSVGMSGQSGSSSSKKVKIGPKTVNFIFIGYAHNSTTYRFLVHESNIPNIHNNGIEECIIL